MRLPSHPVWFWLIVGAPLVAWPALWLVASSGKISLKPLKPWLIVCMCLSGPVYFLYDPVIGFGSHKVLRLLSGEIYWTCFLMLSLVTRQQTFGALRSPAAKWYFPWTSAGFSVPKSMRIQVRNIDSVSPWYVEKLGLRKLAAKPSEESGVATYKFTADGSPVILTTRAGLGTDGTPILLTKKISKIKSVLAERGVDVGIIEKDRQGIRYFQIHDPEGNAIEVVEER